MHTRTMRTQTKPEIMYEKRSQGFQFAETLRDQSIRNQFVLKNTSVGTESQRCGRWIRQREGRVDVPVGEGMEEWQQVGGGGGGRRGRRRGGMGEAAGGGPVVERAARGRDERGRTRREWTRQQGGVDEVTREGGEGGNIKVGEPGNKEGRVSGQHARGGDEALGSNSSQLVSQEPCITVSRDDRVLHLLVDVLSELVNVLSRLSELLWARLRKEILEVLSSSKRLNTFSIWESFSPVLAKFFSRCCRRWRRCLRCWSHLLEHLVLDLEPEGGREHGSLELTHVNLAGCIGIDRTTCTCTDAHNNKSTISSSGALQSARGARSARKI